MGKRALAMLLALMMLVSLVPVQVFAEEPEVPSQEIVEEIIPEESDEDLIAEPEEGDGQDEQITSEDDVLVPGHAQPYHQDQHRLYGGFRWTHGCERL